ncbi:glycosyltransferase [Methylacidiphilum caldifontis]|uniref:Glycosyltransferase 2-like domain-containing protein n=1 Tax=Methylacidiphilum caldifontis TaxID=2795386 RepID=A0A4Y8P8M2_9BACT|nr:glycosyltransferase [Methylacidiphilum caldifontis]TFE66979.1 hypothetical protein A7Q10_01610 [Methylacidiphilum caldifontis]
MGGILLLKQVEYGQSKKELFFFKVLRKIEKELRRFKKRIFQQVQSSHNRNIEVDISLPTSLGDSIKLHVDSPPTDNGKIPCFSGLGLIKGWVIAKKGIKKLNCTIDDQNVDYLLFGFSRPDVAATYPEYRDADKSGFCLKINAQVFENGEHELRFYIETEEENSCIAKKIQIYNLDHISQNWLENNKWLEHERYRFLKIEKNWWQKPLFSFLFLWDIPCHQEEKEDLFSQTLLSLKNQVYSEWEVFLACSQSKPEESFIQALDKEFSGRIKLLFFSKEEDSIRNTLFQQCKGRWLGILSAGDILDPRALHTFAQVVYEHPEEELIYCDEVEINEKNQKRIFFKPSWSPTLLSQYPYIGKLWIVRKDLFLEVLKKDFELTRLLTDQSLINEMVTDPSRVTHIPFVLCEGKKRMEIEIKKEESSPSLTKGIIPQISIIMPSIIKREDVVERCFSSIFEKTTYAHFELLAIVNRYYLAEDDPKRKLLERWPIRTISVDFPYNWSRLNNLGKEESKGEILLFLNDDIEVLSPYWLESMLSHVIKEDVGAVGAKLYYPDMSIQHGGIYFSQSLIGGEHILRYYKDQEISEKWLGELDRECTAVTGACLMVRRSVFEKLGGFDESFPVAFNDVDFCLRARRMGLRNIFCARAKLIHYEGMSRAGIPEENDYQLLVKRWAGAFENGDPYWNPNLLDYMSNWTPNPLAKGSLRGRKTFLK